MSPVYGELLVAHNSPVMVSAGLIGFLFPDSGCALKVRLAKTLARSNQRPVSKYHAPSWTAHLLYLDRSKRFSGLEAGNPAKKAERRQAFIACESFFSTGNNR